MIGLHTYLVISGLVFVFGLITVLNKKNAVGILMGVELILNSVNLNFVAFGHYVDMNIK
jgi:NADH:ubiquinone oxidoreductase subunit K